MIDEAITDATFRSASEAIASARADGRRPTHIYLNTETLDAVKRRLARMGMPDPAFPIATTFFGLRLEMDESLRLGVVRVAKVEA